MNPNPQNSNLSSQFALMPLKRAHKLKSLSAAVLLAIAFIPNCGQAQGIFDAGATAPTPGPFDIYQLTSQAGSGPSGINYYVDKGNPGQIFTTDNGYQLTGLYIQEQSGSAGGGQPGLSAYTLRVYQVSGTTATLLTTYNSTNQMTFTQGDWIQWTGLTNVLQPHTTYGFALLRGSGAGGWWRPANTSANPYPGGQAANFPTTTGAISYGSSSSYDAAFDIRLAMLPLSVEPTQFSPASPVYVGTQVTLSAPAAFGIQPYTYDWQVSTDGGVTFSDLPTGNGGSTYTLNTADQGDTTRYYRLIVTDSEPVPVTVTNAPTALFVSSVAIAPALQTNTTISSSTILLGGSATMNAVFSGAPNVYQWQFSATNDGTGLANIPGATNSSFTLTNAQYGNAGYYRLVATNNAGTASSDFVSLSVLTPMVISDFGAAAPIPNANGYDIAQLDNSGAAVNPAGLYSYDDRGTPPGQTFTTGSDPNGYALASLYIKFGISGNSGNAAGLGYTLRIYSLTNAYAGRATLISTYTNQNIAPAFAANGGHWCQWYGPFTNVFAPNSVYAYTLNQSSGYMMMDNNANNPYPGGQQVNLPQASGNGTFGTAGVSSNYDMTFMISLVPAGGFPGIQAVSISPASSPTNQIYVGTPVMLVGQAIGAATLAYKWQTDNGSGGSSWTDLPNSNTNSYAFDTSSLAAGIYQYQLVVANSFGSITSSPVTLYLQAPLPPAVATDTTITPSGVLIGGSTTMRATFTGTPPISYQWMFDNGSGATPVPNATSATFVLANAQLANSGVYFLQASNSVSPYIASSSPVQFVVAKPAQNNAASAIIIDAGSSAPSPGAYDIAQLVGEPPTAVPGLNYYVDSSSPPGQTFTTGNNPPTPEGYPLTSIYIQEELSSADTGGLAAQSYTLGIYSVSGSNAVLLTSYTSANTLAITEYNWIQWIGLTNILQPNSTYAFSIHRNGSGTWKLSNDQGYGDLYPDGQAVGLPASGVGAITYSTDPAIDAAFMIGLTPPGAPVLVQDTKIQPSSSAFVGRSVTISAYFSGSSPVSYQWQFTDTNGVGPVNIPGATNNTYSIPSVQYADSGTYVLLASNALSGDTYVSSTPATLEVLPFPTNFVINFSYAPYSGSAVIGDGSYWNQITINGSATVNGVSVDAWTNVTSFADDGTSSLQIGFNTYSTWEYTAGTGNPMLDSYLLLQGQPTTSLFPFSFTKLPSGVYNLVLYGCDGTYVRGYTTFTVNGVSQTCTNKTDASFVLNDNYVVFTNIVVTGGTLNGFWSQGTSAEVGFNGAQLELINATAPVNMNPTNVTATVSGGQLTLSWPADHIGWHLQCQTNALNTGLGTNWVDVTGASTTNQMIIPVNPANGSVFFRLVSP